MASRRPGSWTTTRSSAPRTMPIAIERTSSAVRPSVSALKMIATLRSESDSEGRVKRWSANSVDIRIVEIASNRTAGRIQRTSSIVRSTVSMPRADSPPPSAVMTFTAAGAKNCSSSTIAPTTTVARTSNAPVMRRSSWRECSPTYSERTGISAACIMPLMTRSNSIVWTLSAMMNAAIWSPAPNMYDAVCSRTSPSTRDRMLPIIRTIAAKAMPRPPWPDCSAAGDVVVGRGG